MLSIDFFGGENRCNGLMAEYHQNHIAEEHMWEIVVMAIFGNYNLPKENSETVIFVFAFFRYLNFLPGCL